MQTNNDWVHHSSGVDYLRVTAPDEATGAKLKSMFTLAAIRKQAEGYEQNVANRLGYNGWVAGPWFYGVRDDGFMLQVSGPDSGTAMAQIKGYDVNCTRIDVQHTLQCACYLPLWGGRQAILTNSARVEAGGQNWAKIRHLNTFGEGDTVTIGSRSSDKYGRLYDKAIEALDPYYERCWRYEVEYKGIYAPAAYARLQAGQDLAADAAGLVGAQFAAWLMPLPIMQGVGDFRLPADTTKSDRARKLEWIRKQVVPTMVKLLDLGAEEELDEIIKTVYDRYRGH